MSQLVGLAAADEDGGQHEQLAVGSPDALEEALAKYGTPRIFNTDQGSQFTSEQFTHAQGERHPDQHGRQGSMDG